MSQESAAQVYSPFVNKESPFPQVSADESYIYRLGQIRFGGGPSTAYETSINYDAQMNASFAILGDESFSRVFVTTLGAPTPSGEEVVRDSGFLGSVTTYADSLAAARSVSGDMSRSWGLSYNVYAVVPLPSVNINVASGTQTQTQAGYATVAHTPALIKTGPGTLIMDNVNTYTGTTTVSEGTLKITNPLAVQASTVVVKTGGVVQLPSNTPIIASMKSIVCDVASGGKIDVGNGLVNCFPPGASPDALRNLIIAGMGDGSWNGTGGIMSSVAATSGGDRTVGWLDNGDGTVTFGYAAPGDSNLDWQIDILDAANFLSGGKFDSGASATWAEGDYTYDGVVDILDGAGFLSTGLFDAGPYNAPAGSIAAVPEPSTYAIILAGLAWGGLTVRRRCRS